MEESKTVQRSLKALSNDKSLILFETIANQALNTYNILTRLALTKKQYYLRLSSLVDAGLIQRKKGTYGMTSFGKVVYKALTLIGQAVSNQWKLKAIDSLEMSTSDYVQEEVPKLMELLIDNLEIRDILISTSNDNGNSKQSEIKSLISS